MILNLGLRQNNILLLKSHLDNIN